MARLFEGRVVVVTGASAGIGRAIALAFAKPPPRLEPSMGTHPSSERISPEEKRLMLSLREPSRLTGDWISPSTMLARLEACVHVLPRLTRPYSTRS